MLLLPQVATQQLIMLEEEGAAFKQVAKRLALHKLSKKLSAHLQLPENGHLHYLEELLHSR